MRDKELTILDILGSSLCPSTLAEITNRIKSSPESISLVKYTKIMQVYGDALLDGKISASPTEKNRILRFCYRCSKLIHDYDWIQKYPGDDPVIKSFQYLLIDNTSTGTYSKLELIGEMLEDYSIDQDPEKWGGFLSLLNIIIILLGSTGMIGRLRERVREARDIYTYQKENKLYTYIFAKLLSNASWWEQKIGDNTQAKKINAEILDLSKQLGNIPLEADITALLHQNDKPTYISSQHQRNTTI